MKEITTITVSKSTKAELGKMGKFGQSYDQLILDLVQKVKEND